MNTAFVVIGILVIIGVFGLKDLIPPSRARQATVVLLVIGGISCSLTGFVPVNTDTLLHWLVAAPTFLTRNLAMGVIAIPLMRRWRTFGWWTVACFAVGTLGMLWILLPGRPFGMAERVSLSPFPVWAVSVGITVIVRGKKLDPFSITD